MEIRKVMVEGETVLKLTGNLVSSDTASLTTEITELLKTTNHIILDFTNVEYMASAGIRVLLSTRNKLSEKCGKLTILHPNEVVVNVLNMTGIAPYVDIVE